MRILRHKPFKAIGIKPRNPRLARNILQFYNDFGHGAVIPLVAQVIEVKIAAFTFPLLAAPDLNYISSKEDPTVQFVVRDLEKAVKARLKRRAERPGGRPKSPICDRVKILHLDAVNRRRSAPS
jgi:hypothetical protein